MHRRLAVVALALVYPLRLPAQGDKPVPLAELEAAARRDSLDAETLYQLALRYDLTNRYDDAERVAREAVNIDPRCARAWLLLAYLPYDRRPKLWEEVSKGKVPAAWQAAVAESDRLERRAFLIDPLVDFRVKGAPPPKQDIVTIPDYGEYTTAFLLQLGLSEFGWRYELAYNAFDLYAQRRYRDQPIDSIPSGLFWLRGLAAAHLGSYVRAIADIQVLLDRSLLREAGDSLIQMDLGTSDFRYLLGLFKQRAHRPADAMTLYQQALASDLGLYMAHVRLAQLYAENHMWAQAVEEARRAVTANPDDPSLLVDLAEMLRDAGRLAEAEAAFRQAAQANARNPRVAYELGLVEQQVGNPGAAKQALTRFMAIAPSGMSTEIADAKQRLAALPASVGNQE
ncbi:MAG TPA: tetratricopeptide repeat protein [Gemmatimonadales bacterium]|nr:tetratricopeptide repeat protein [Gemmatimonadales bacterium]